MTSMPLINKKIQNRMESKDKDINIVYTPQIGLGRILFSFQENDIVKVLEIPDERVVDIFDSSEYVIYLY
jgi:hypothetical protein